MLKSLFFDRRSYVFYHLREDAPAGQADPAVSVYTTWDDIPEGFRGHVLPRPLLNIMYHRLRAGKAKLLCLSEDDAKLQAFGWVQDWSPFQKKFGAFLAPSTVLGPYNTLPGERRKGFYGRLLSHSLSLCGEDGSVVIYATPDNHASHKGITRAGFEPVGAWEVTVWLRLIARHRALELEAGTPGA